MTHRIIRMKKLQSWLVPELFKWQWCIEYEELHVTGDWVSRSIIFETRREAREFHDFWKTVTYKRNWVLKRRRVQRKWEIYGRLK
jgi:hypothetical protein